MRAPRALHDYHVVCFDHAGEAASFVAALSRFLDSPRGSHFADGALPLEVWIDANAHEGVPVELYVSDGALAAITEGFKAPPLAGTRRGSKLPADSALLIGAVAPPHGELPA